MKYETPVIRIMSSEIDDVITSSDGLVMGDDLNHGEGF